MRVSQRLDMPTIDAAPSLAQLVHASDKTGALQFPPCSPPLASTIQIVSHPEPPWLLKPPAVDVGLVCLPISQVPARGTGAALSVRRCCRPTLSKAPIHCPPSLAL